MQRYYVIGSQSVVCLPPLVKKYFLGLVLFCFNISLFRGWVVACTNIHDYKPNWWQEIRARIMNGSKTLRKHCGKEKNISSKTVKNWQWILQRWYVVMFFAMNPWNHQISKVISQLNSWKDKPVDCCIVRKRVGLKQPKSTIQ